ncbi:MAG: alanine racemase [Acidobacteriota bacterium]
MTRRSFLSTTLAAAAAVSTATTTEARRQTVRLRPGGSDDGFDPWIEIIGDHLRHNVREVARLAGGRPILAVVKNNAYGLGDTIVGPLLDSCKEVGGIACVRPGEALAMRAAGVRKTMLTMAELGTDESAELVRQNVTLSCWLDEAPARLQQVARKARRRVPVHLFLDTGMNREGMPIGRAIPWMEQIAKMNDVRIDGTYQMFVHQRDFNRVQLTRFQTILAEARARGLKPGVLHAAPTYELYRLPEAHFDMVRVGNAIFGAPPGADVTAAVDLKPVFRLRARVTRVERVESGESAGFRRGFQPTRATRVATVPVGHTDGYPDTAGGRCEVLIGGQLYPVVTGGVASAHTLVDVGLEGPVKVGDTVTLIGPEAPAILPVEVGTRTEVGFFFLRTRLSALLPRKLV